jgi:hypothetical protein
VPSEMGHVIPLETTISESLKWFDKYLTP